jgi:uncharacterized protein (DUF2147 family)
MKHLLLFFMISLMGLSTYAQKATAILGTWYTEENKSLVEIYQENGKFYAKMISLKNPIDPLTGKAKLDKENPDPKLKSRPLIGIILLKDLRYESENYWGGGEIYDPESGNTYSCRLKMNGNNELDMRGYMGISLIGRSTTWKRKS